jgi:nicotinamide riboside transporter PnuC
MVPLWWSILLTAVGVLGIWLAGQRNLWGWAIGVAAQGLWIAYAIATRQWGFIGSALAYGFVYARALYRWRRDALRAREQAP